MVTCSNCHTTIASTDRIYCPSCGAELPDETESHTSSSTGQNKNKINSGQMNKSGASGDHARSQQTGESSPGGGNKTNQIPAESPSSQQHSDQSPRTENHTGSSPKTEEQPEQSSYSERQTGASSGPDNPPGSKRTLNQRGDSSHTGDQTPEKPEQSGQRRPHTDSSGRSDSDQSLVDGSSQDTSVPNVNKIAWWCGWHPLAIIGIFTVLIAIIALGIDILGLSIIGPLIGMGVWYWGVREINTNYKDFRSAFFARSEQRAEDRLAIDPDEVIDTFNFRSHTGSSPLLVRPSKSYRADHLILSDVSVSVDKNSRFNMQDRASASTGTTKNVYYDNIETITTNDEGNLTNLRIATSRGDDLHAVTVDQNVAEQAQGRLRSEMRDVRRTQY